MSYFATTQIQGANDGTTDAFQRIRTSQATTLFDSQFQYDLQPLVWETVTTGTATVAHLSAESAVQMTTTTAGDYGILQSRQYHRYQPGKSQAIFMTFQNMSAQNVAIKQAGYFDNSNGIFLQSSGGTYYIVRRNSASGSVVDTQIPQASWNIDRFDGTGPSGVTLDFSKDQILVIDFQWLGVGRVRVGFDVDGRLYYAHQFLNANNLTTVYMATPNLPLRYALSANGPATFKPICSAVVAEAGFEAERGYSFSASNKITGVTAGATQLYLLTIRPLSSFKGQTPRGQILPMSYDICTNAANAVVYFELTKNATFSAPPSYTAVSADSMVEYSVGNGTITVTGGTVVDSGYVAGSRVSQTATLPIKVPLSLSYNGLSANTLTLSIINIAGTPPTFGAFSWQELR